MHQARNARLPEFIFTVSSILLLPCSIAGNHGDTPPNVLIILADDMGYSDAGCFGSEIKTPNLDLHRC